MTGRVRSNRVFQNQAKSKVLLGRVPIIDYCKLLIVIERSKQCIFLVLVQALRMAFVHCILLQSECRNSAEQISVINLW